jgi:hypothetical protein
MMQLPGICGMGKTPPQLASKPLDALRRRYRHLKP